MGQAKKPDDMPPVSYVRMSDREAWHNVLCERFAPTEFAPDAETRFRGELTYVNHGATRMSRIHSSAGRFSRNSQAIRRDNFDGFQLLISLDGELRLSQGDKRLEARRGEALLYRHGAPFELDLPRKYRALSLWVEPEMMSRHSPAAVNGGPMLLGSATTNGNLALMMLRELCLGTIERRAAQTTQLVRATLDVLETTVPAGAAEMDTQHRWLVEKLTAYVERNIDDTDLDLGRLVEAAGVSARTLNRAFAAQGTTPMRWVWEQRLGMARDALIHARVRNVTEAAFGFGFKGTSHFSRAFSRKYGVTPNSIRQS